jgi:hypothetical protein
VSGSRADSQAALAAAAASGTMIAFQLAGKATRDALFLSTFGVAALPRMLIAGAILSVVLSIALARILARAGPARIIPPLFGVSATLMMAEWFVAGVHRPLAAVLVYLHLSGFGALLVSGFWALVNERFDPRTARGTIGRITAGASIGGLLGGILPERIGAAFQLTAMLPILALFHLLAAFLVLAVWRGAHRPAGASAVADAPRLSGARIFRSSRYLQRLALLVALTAAAEGTLDLVFKARATATTSNGEELLRLFAAFYTVTALVGILLQVTALRGVLQRIGPARSVAILPAGVTVAAGATLALPGLASVLLARASEVILHASVFRAGYELLFTPVARREKRATKPLLDVVAARVGDVAAGGFAQATLAVSGSSASGILLGATMVLSAAALAVARRLHQGYTAALAGSLHRRAAQIPLPDESPASLLQTAGAFDLTELRTRLVEPVGEEEEVGAPSPEVPSTNTTPADRRRALADPRAETVRAALRAGPITTELLDPAIALLAWDEIAPEAIRALRDSAGDHISGLVSHLLDPDEDFAIRRRLVSVLTDQPAAEAIDGLVRALDDRRFEVRYRAGRALRRLAERPTGLALDPARVIAVVLREVTVERGVWESRQLIDAADDEWETPVVDVVRERANRSLEHVFTLLSLILPRTTVQLAYQGLQTDDPHLRGTALEYLESVLPDAVRERLWPFLEDSGARPGKSGRPAEDVVRALLASKESIMLALHDVRRRRSDSDRS